MTTTSPSIPDAAGRKTGSMTFTNLREANIARQIAWCGDGDPLPDLSFRGVELAGETGEVCNVIKKLERERHGWRGSRDTFDHLAEELADVVICADLTAISASINLDAAVTAKFNATSEKVGLPHRLSVPPSPSAGQDLWAAAQAVINSALQWQGSDSDILEGSGGIGISRELLRRLRTALASSALDNSAGTADGWQPITVNPGIGRKVIALFNDGSGSMMLWLYDGGMLDCEGDEVGAWPPKSCDQWVYLPDALEFYCETGEDPIALAVPPSGLTP